MTSKNISTRRDATTAVSDTEQPSPKRGETPTIRPTDDSYEGTALLRKRRWLAWTVALAFAALALISGVWLIAGRAPEPSATVSTPIPAPTLITSGAVPGYETVGSHTETYRPGDSRSLDASEGLHQVTVLDGTLSVEDAQGDQRTYVSGQSYVAGWAPYSVSNPTDTAVHVIVQYLRPVTVVGSDAPAMND